MINDLLSEVKISFEEIAAIVVCGGPGSYTGLRIGMATAKGLCYALDKPTILDNRLDLLAYQAYAQHGKTYSQYIVLLTAREKEYFISIYNNDFICTLPPQHIEQKNLSELAEQKENTYIITDGNEQTVSHLINNTMLDLNVRIDLPIWIFYSFEEYNCNKTVNSLTAEPFYLKQVYTHK